MSKLSAYSKDVFAAKICPYCKSENIKIISETDVYGREYKGRKIIACGNYPACDSYVGTHDDGTALGRLANKELRLAKKEAHNTFDRLWKSKEMSRGKAYQMLSDFLEIDSKYTHIGMFSVETCKKIIEWVKSNQWKQF